MRNFATLSKSTNKQLLLRHAIRRASEKKQLAVENRIANILGQSQIEFEAGEHAAKTLPTTGDGGRN